jgi:heme-degrading monooxygenase HmoA
MKRRFHRPNARFESLSRPGTLLALSFWRNEQAVSAWRNAAAHREAQAAGRAGLFRGYSIRIARVIREYGPDDRDQAPTDSRAIHG